MNFPRLLSMGVMGMVMGMSPAIQAQEVKVDFESGEGYVLGPLPSGAGWSLVESSSAAIVTEQASSGTQSLKIEAGVPGAEIHYTKAITSGSAVRFVDVWLKPVATDAEGAETSLSAWGASLGFVKGGNGTIQAALVDGQKETGRAVATGLPYGETGAANQWVRVTLRQNPLASTWDIYLDGKLAAIDLGMDSEGREKLVLNGSESAATYVDAISVQKENPLFADEDGDGMSDAEEVANGLNPHLDDRNGDVDGDGVSNIAEMLAGTSPRLAGAAGAGGTVGVLYVDNLNGNDANSGKRSYAVEGDGPKASIKGAMAAAESGNLIVIMPGKGVYEEGSRGAGGKRLTLKAMERVTIK